MNSLGIASMTKTASSPAPRRRFGLETLLPTDPAIIEAQVLRLLARHPEVLAVRPSASPDRPVRAGHRPGPAFVPGAPDLLLLLPGGRTICLKIRTQAERLSRQEAVFGDLCRERGIPFAVVRSVAEARAALARFGIAIGEA
jgi:hypothetical protein